MDYNALGNAFYVPLKEKPCWKDKGGLGSIPLPPSIVISIIFRRRVNLLGRCHSCFRLGGSV